MASTPDDGHLNGCMIALMPTVADAKRLALAGGEKASDLHLTLYFLADDADTWDEDARTDLLYCMKLCLDWCDYGPVKANIFGAAHWNGGGPKPSWVWSVGDGLGVDGYPMDSMSTSYAHSVALDALSSMHRQPELPPQHCPWVPHVCAAYSDDLTMVKDLETRLGPVTFDRIRVSFGSEDHDFELTGDGSMTAAANQGPGPRRRLTETEIESRADFAMIDKQWRDAVGSMMSDYSRVLADQRTELKDQIITLVDADNLAALDTLHVDTEACARVLREHMLRYAQLAGTEMQREAEHQGVQVPPWDLNTTMTAASAVDVITATARTTARNLGLGLVQSAARKVMSLVGISRPGREVAAKVDESIKLLSTAGPKEQIGAAMSTAQNAGRVAVLSVAPAGVYVASEALDLNTCKPCRAVDGTEFESLGAAREAYPAGGYVDCQGGGRCRGTMIAVWGKGETASAAQEVSMATVTEDLGGKPNPGTKPDKRLRENPKGKKYEGDTLATDDCEGEDCDEGMAALAEEILAGKTQTLADDSGCPPNMQLDPGTGECTPVKAGEQATQTAAWEGVLVVEGETTGDGREFAPEALSWPDPIEPGEVLLRWNKEDSHGGTPKTTAVAVGRIDKIWKDGNKIMGQGVFDLGQPDGAEAYRRVSQKFLRGVSIDADDVKNADVELVWPEPTGDEEADLMAALFGQPDKQIFHGGRIRAATLCDIPAFIEAYIALKDDEGTIVAGGASEELPGLVREHKIGKLREMLDARKAAALVAHGGPDWKPPAEWFENPSFTVPTTIHVSDEGRVYGHAAQWESCHIGFMDVCTKPPREEGFPYFLTGELITAEGTSVPVGQITVTANHADLYTASGPAKEHYENTGNAVADVTIGADRIGIWVAGAIRPGADHGLIHELRASGEVSGDWRKIGGQYRLVGLLGVNVGGFVVPNLRARVAGGQVQALVAAGRLNVARPHARPDRMNRDQAYKIVMDDLYAQMVSPDTEGSE